MPTQKADHRTVVGLYALIAQSVEPAAVNRVVVGSSPTEGAKFVIDIIIFIENYYIN